MSGRFSDKRRFTRGQVGKIPDDKPGIYKLWQGNELVYVGIAQRGRLQERLEEHLPDGKDPVTGATRVQVKRVHAIADARREEKKIIEREKPRDNEKS